MKEVSLKIIIITFLFFTSCWGTYQLTFFLAEKYYFDKFFYRKSALFGYNENYSERGILFYNNNNAALEKRIKDLRNLLALNQSSQILGANDNNKFKVAVIGDSFVYGLGVRAEDRFSSLLEKKLNKLLPTEVFNLGIPGHNTLENYTKYLLAEETFRPDLYIFAVLQNDLVLLGNLNNGYYNDYPTEQATLKQLMTVCDKPEFIPIPNQQRSWEQLLEEEIYPSSFDQYANICYFREIIKKIDKGKTIFLFYDSPGQYEEREDKNTIDMNLEVTNKLASIIRQAEGEVLFCDANFLKDAQVSNMEGHPSKSAH